MNEAAITGATAAPDVSHAGPSPAAASSRAASPPPPLRRLSLRRRPLHRPSKPRAMARRAPSRHVTISPRPNRAGNAPGTTAPASTSPTCRSATSRNTTCSKCFPTPAARSTWGTCATTRWATWLPATSAREASTCCTRWAGMRSACRPRTPRANAACTPPNGRTSTSTPCAASCSAWACRSTGRASSPPAIRNITATSRSCSSTSSLPAWWSARKAGSTGTRSRGQCSPTSR